MLGNEIENMKKEIEDIGNESKSIAYELIHDGEKAKERDHKIILMLIGVIMFLILILSIINGIWIWYINQYDFTTETIEQYQEDTDNSQITGVIN
jgi:hypothetical protein